MKRNGLLQVMLQALDRINLSLASPRSAGENTLDMLEIMTRAFDESEGGEGGEVFFCYTDLQLKPWPAPKIQYCRHAAPNVIPPYICAGYVRAVRGPNSVRVSCAQEPA